MDKNRDYTKLLKNIAKGAAIISIAAGTLVLLGWIFNISILKGLGPDFISMKVNTAICFILLGLSLFLNAEYKKVRGAKIAANIFGVVVLVIALATLGEYVYGWDLSIDQALFRDTSVVGSSFPGRMAIVTMINFILLSFTLLISDLKKEADIASDLIVISVFFSSLFYLNEYIFQDPVIYASTGVAPLALNTSVTFIILSLGVKMINPERGLSRILILNNLGGNVARKILPAIIFLPTLIAWIEAMLVKSGILSGYYTHSALGVVNAAIFGAIVLNSAYVVSDAENSRLKDLDLRHKAELDLSKAIDEIKEKNSELEKLNKVFIKRELDNIEIKKSGENKIT